MPSESVPQIAETNRLLSRIQQVEHEVSEKISGQTEHLDRGFAIVERSIAAQTETLGELQLIGRVAEMNSIAMLLGQEELLLADERKQDQHAIDQIDRTYENSRKKLEDARSRRVRELLAPVYELLDHDLEGHIQSRKPGAETLLENSIAATRDVMGSRESTLGDLIEAATVELGNLTAERQSVRSQLALAKWDADVAAGDEASLYGVPFYFVEIEDQRATKRIMVVPPSSLTADPTHPAGFTLQPLPKFAEYTEVVAKLWSRTKSLFERPRNRTTEEAMSSSLNLTHQEPSRQFREAMSVDRQISFGEEPAPPFKASTVVARFPRIAAGRAVLRVETPSVDAVPFGSLPDKLTVAVDHFERREFEEARALLMDLKDDGDKDPRIGSYLAACRRALSKEM